MARRDVRSVFDPRYAVLADLWGAWRFAAAESALSLSDWMLAGPEEKQIGYDVYLACLDREEQAASALAERLDLDDARHVHARS